MLGGGNSSDYSTGSSEDSSVAFDFVADSASSSADQDIDLLFEKIRQDGGGEAEQAIQFYAQFKVHFSQNPNQQIAKQAAQYLIEHRREIVQHILQKDRVVSLQDPFILSMFWGADEGLLGKEDLIYLNLALISNLDSQVMDTNIKIFRESYPIILGKGDLILQCLPRMLGELYDSPESNDVEYGNEISLAWLIETSLDINEYIPGTKEELIRYEDHRSQVAIQFFSNFKIEPTLDSLDILLEDQIAEALSKNAINVDTLVQKHITFLEENSVDSFKKPEVWKAILLRGTTAQKEQLKTYMEFTKDVTLQSQFARLVDNMSQAYPEAHSIQEIKKLTTQKGFAVPSKAALLALTHKRPEDAFLELYKYIENCPNLVVPVKLNQYLAENAGKIASKVSVREQELAVIQICKWYMKHDASSEKKGAVANDLVWLLSYSEDIDDMVECASLLPKIQTFNGAKLQDTFISLSNLQKKFYEGLGALDEATSAEQKDKIEMIAKSFLLHTHFNQKFLSITNENVSKLNTSRVVLAFRYFLNKTSEYTLEDIQILSDPNTLKQLLTMNGTDGFDCQKIVNQAVQAMYDKNPDFIKNRDNWMLITLSQNEALIGELNKYVQQADEYDMAYLARVHNKILGVPSLVQGFNVGDYCTQQKEKFLKLSAIRGNRYAQQKLRYLDESEPERAKALQTVSDAIKGIDEHISLLQEAKVSRGLRGFKYTFFGSKKYLDKQIKKLEEQKTLIAHYGDNLVKDERLEIKTVLQGVESVSKKSREQFAARKRRAGITGGILNVMSLGIYPLYISIQSKVADSVVGTAPLKGSSYKWWRNHYNLLVDTMDVAANECDKVAKKEDEANRLAREELAAIEDRVSELERIVKDQEKPFYKRWFGIQSKEEKELLQEKGKLAKSKKDVYVTDRDKKSAASMDFYRNHYPGLEIEERTVVTEDGKHLDILIVNNKNAQLRNPGKVNDVIHFSGTDCYYQLDTRQFEHAISQGSNLIVVHDRKKSPESGASEARKSDLATDGVAAVEYVINMRKKQAAIEGREYNANPILHGYCGGGPIAILTEKRLRKAGKPLKFIADRTFHTTSAVIRSVMGQTDPNSSRYEKLKAWGINTFVGPVLRAFNWETDIAKELKKIPEHSLLEYELSAPTPDYYEDLTIEAKARNFQGLKDAREKKLKALDAYEKQLTDMMALYINPTLAPAERQRIIETFDALKKTLDYIRESYNMSQVLAAKEEHLVKNPHYDPSNPRSPEYVYDSNYHGHIEPTSDFKLRDESSLNAQIFDFVNSIPTDSEVSFQPIAISLAPEKDQAKLNQFWHQSLKIFEEFYNNGKRMQNTHHADHDIRLRINDFFKAINAHNVKLKANQKLNLVLPETADHYSPQIVLRERKPESSQKDQAKRSGPKDPEVAKEAKRPKRTGKP